MSIANRIARRIEDARRERSNARRKAANAALPAGYVGYYDRGLRLWVVYRHDDEGNQIGPCGYGTTKLDALDDCQHHSGRYVPTNF